MEKEGFKGHSKDSHHWGDGRDHKKSRHGAKTFRRGRAIAFLERMNLKRSILKQQLETPELQSINPILVGELKAIDMVINEFVQLFEIHESEVIELPNEKKEPTKSSLMDSKQSGEERNSF
ncbi:hypothetical protein [Cytobacillus purgationiresistens]|uniref:Uncharacterized protein n=1 Tax=Cytobacillus purgationiresistens TaxID=863449 RepID=A0ABU0AGJ4_9BACI|nr:hypothetical protein [Cytobacillus purgationiresistens]MDQ0270386.1 hypothetical protein [Cytobacillus purgationiresistens]